MTRTCQAMRSKLSVSKSVLQPIRAAASAASHPACPPPTTMTSKSSSWLYTLVWAAVYEAGAGDSAAVAAHVVGACKCVDEWLQAFKCLKGRVCRIALAFAFMCAETKNTHRRGEGALQAARYQGTVKS